MAVKSDYQARLHWIIFLLPLSIIAAAAGVFWYLPSSEYVSLMLLTVGLIFCFMTWMTYVSSRLEIGGGCVRFKSGVLIRESVNIPFAKIETIDIRQSIVGSFLNYGTLIVTGSGGSRTVMDRIADPLRCRREIEQCIHS